MGDLGGVTGTELMERETRPLSRSKPHPLPPTRRFPDSGKVDRRPAVARTERL